jgi:SSS family solute:Na+ symporter
MVFPGIVGYVLWQRGVLHLPSIHGTDTPDYNTMLPVLINHLVPVGLKGLLAACMAAALMSCMAAALNSCATLISVDIVKRNRPDTPDRRVVLIGRVATGVIMVLAMLWSTQGDQFGTIFEAINKIPMTFAPAVTTVFLLGITWKRGTKEAAMATLYIGSVVGAFYFVLDLPSVGRALLAPDILPGNFAGLVTDRVYGLGIPFMLAGPMLTVVCVLIYVTTSLFTPPMDERELAKVCWNRPWDFLRGPLAGVADPRVVAGLLVATVGVLYYLLK